MILIRIRYKYYHNDYFISYLLFNNNLLISTFLQVEHFSRFYKKLVNAQEYSFSTCNICFKYKAQTEECSCNGEPANHLIGCWELVKVVTSPLRTRLYFNKDDVIFCHVVFAKNLDGIGLKAKEFYYLEGWQKKDTRRNCLIIYESIPAEFDFHYLYFYFTHLILIIHLFYFRLE